MNMPKLPPFVHNRISYIGTAIAALSGIVFGFLLFLQTVSDAARAPYASLVIFIFIPTVLLFGVTLIPIGMLLERRHVRLTGHHSVPRFPVIDFNDPRQRNLTGLFVVGSIIVIFVAVFGGFQAYEATESVVFCGQLCHTVMQPEFTTYENSPHARVKCVDCHVGPGAEWYVKSKLSGLYQVYAVTFDQYPRPITGPISSLRPAQQTCEQCHWPEQFFEAQERRLVHFLPDEQNTRWQISLLIKTGGGKPGLLHTGGIHWHMNIQNRIEYIATDPERQVIPWVRLTDRETGTAKEYMSTANPLSKEEIAKASARTMDCMDCHNRPSHIFRSPRESVNAALSAGKIDSTLPFIKKTGVELLAADYASTDAAMQGIEQGMTEFYQKSYPEVMTQRRALVTKAVKELQVIYRQNFFPVMKARWDEYPNNIGHLMFNGCFRCHDGQHQTADGKVIRKDCTICHTITAQGKADAMQYAQNPDGLGFQHPEDIGGMWQDMACDECHKGTVP
jgi:nitrate/TMAO reductase-like tetraheme cytochrome c subunit